MCMHLCVYLHMCVCVLCMCMCVCAVYVYVCVCVCVCVCFCVSMCVYMCAFMCMCVICMCVHIRIVHIYVSMCTCIVRVHWRQCYCILYSWQQTSIYCPFFKHLYVTAPPIIDTDCSEVPDFLEPVTGFLSFDAGCDLCFELGQKIETLEVECAPSGFLSRQPITCNFQIGTEPVTPIPGRLASEFGTLTFTNLMNPPLSPELNLLQTYTCNCSNDDGFALASTTIGSCCEYTVCLLIQVVQYVCTMSMYVQYVCVL